MLPERDLRKARPSNDPSAERFDTDAFVRATCRLEHAALAPLSEERLEDWLAEMHGALTALADIWSAWLASWAEATPPVSGPRPSRTRAEVAFDELRALREEVRALNEHVRASRAASDALNRSWTLRDLAVFTSVDVRMFYDDHQRRALDQTA